MKKLETLIEKRNGAIVVEPSNRGKLIVLDTENRPEYVEMTVNDGTEQINIHFADDTFFKGTLDELKTALKLAELSKTLCRTVKFGNDEIPVIQQMMSIVDKKDNNTSNLFKHPELKFDISLDSINDITFEIDLSINLREIEMYDMENGSYLKSYSYDNENEMIEDIITLKQAGFTVNE